MGLKHVQGFKVSVQLFMGLGWHKECHVPFSPYRRSHVDMDGKAVE